MPSDPTAHGPGPDPRAEGTHDPDVPQAPPPAPGARRDPPPPAPGEPTTADDQTAVAAPHRLPAVSMLSGISPRSLLSSLPALVVAANTFERFLGLAVIVVAVLVGIGRVLHWQRFRWGFDGQVLHVHSGLIWRSRRAVDVARMQQVELERPLLHRVLGTALLRVETAADAGDTEVALSGLDMATATRLREAISAARRRVATPSIPGSTSSTSTPTNPSTTPPTGPPTSRGERDAPVATAGPPVPPTVEVFRPTVGDLVRHAVTGRALLLLPAGLLAILQFGGDFGLFDDDLEQVAGSAANSASSIGIVVAVLAVVAVLVVLGLVMAVGATLLRDWDLVLVRQGDDLRLTRGLLNQLSATVPMQRLQVIEYHQNWVRRRLGVGTVQLRSAGGGGTEENRRITVPWVPRAVAAQILSIGLVGVGVGDGDDDLPLDGRRHPPAARRRLWFQWLRGAWIPILGLSAAPLALLPDRRGVVAGAGAVLLVLAGFASWSLSGAQYRRLGHEVTDRVLLVTGGVLGRASTWMPLGRLQGVEARANPFQRRLDLVTVVLAPAGGGNRPVEIRDVAQDRAATLGRHFVDVAAGRVVPVDPVGRADPTTGRGADASGPA